MVFKLFLSHKSDAHIIKSTELILKNHLHTSDVQVDLKIYLLCFFIGLQTSEDARFYALSRKFKPFSNEGKDLVIQFTVKHEQDIDCGGGYIKVFDCKLDQKDMHGESPYEIMFGPDICGPGTKKVSYFSRFKKHFCYLFIHISMKDRLGHPYIL